MNGHVGPLIDKALRRALRRIEELLDESHPAPFEFDALAVVAWSDPGSGGVRVRSRS
jgi:hypothetical protein